MSYLSSADPACAAAWFLRHLLSGRVRRPPTVRVRLTREGGREGDAVPDDRGRAMAFAAPDEGEELQRAELYGLLARLWLAPPDEALLQQFAVAGTQAPEQGARGGGQVEQWVQGIGHGVPSGWLLWSWAKAKALGR